MFRKRGNTLDEILFKEKQIAHMDYLRHEMQISKNIERLYNMKDRRIAE